jgi:hypothetical protein
LSCMVVLIGLAILLFIVRRWIQICCTMSMHLCLFQLYVSLAKEWNVFCFINPAQAYHGLRELVGEPEPEETADVASVVRTYTPCPASCRQHTAGGQTQAPHCHPSRFWRRLRGVALGPTLAATSWRMGWSKGPHWALPIAFKLYTCRNSPHSVYPMVWAPTVYRLSTGSCCQF